jgi:hypothetical protein
MLAAEIWHFWVGVVLFVASLGAVVALVAGYLKSVSSSRYPNKRQQPEL